MKDLLDIHQLHDLKRDHAVYIDCANSPEICAQYTVFSLPVVKVYIQGMLITEECGAFSIKHLLQKLERPYQMWCDSNAQPFGS